MTLWLVQPVHGRAGLTRLCMEQRRRMLDELARRGIAAEMVVVGDDANLATAREFGFHTLERPNRLGFKVNEGVEYACREGGADFVSYIGSDDWCLADWYATMPPPDRIKTSKWVAFVAPEGTELVVREVPGAQGNAPWIVPRELLERVGFRPAADERMSGIDGSIRRSIAAPLPGEFATWPRERRQARRARFELRFAFEHGDPLRMVDFKGSREQITAYGIAAGRVRWVRYRESDPWAVLATRYPADLVERMAKFYAEGMPQ